MECSKWDNILKRVLPSMDLETSFSNHLWLWRTPFFIYMFPIFSPNPQHFVASKHRLGALRLPFGSWRQLAASQRLKRCTVVRDVWLPGRLPGRRGAGVAGRRDHSFGTNCDCRKLRCSDFWDQLRTVVLSSKLKWLKHMTWGFP